MGRRVKSRLLLSTCQRVLEKDSEPLVAPGEQVGALSVFLRHQCVNVCVSMSEYNAQCKAPWIKVLNECTIYQHSQLTLNAQVCTVQDLGNQTLAYKGVCPAPYPSLSHAQT